MKMGFIEWGIGGKPIPEKVKVIAEAGFNCISLHPFFSSAAEQGETIKAVENLNLGVTFHTTNEQPEVILEKVDDYIAVISLFQKQTGKVACFSFDQYYLKEGDSIRLEFDVMSTIISKSVDRLSPLGIEVAVENGTCLTKREEFELLIDRIGRKDFGILLDLGHMNLNWLRGELPVDEYIYSLPLEIFELHIHDNDGEKDLHQPLGMGSLDLKTVAKALKRRKFDGVATLEIGSPNIAGDEWIKTIKTTRDIFLEKWEE